MLQAMFGFEFELHVVLSQGPPEQTEVPNLDLGNKLHPKEQVIPTTTEEWLKGLFIGIQKEMNFERTDLIRDYSRFGRARKLPLEDVGPVEVRKKGVPLEARQANTPFAATDVPIGQWMDVAEKYYNMLRMLNAPQQQLILPTLGNFEKGSRVTVSDKLIGTIMGQSEKQGFYIVKLETSQKEMPIPWDKVKLI